MQELQGLSPDSTPGGSGNFYGSGNLNQAQNDFLTNQIATTGTVAINLNTVTAQNGYAFTGSRCPEPADLADTLYSGFISNIQDTNMATAATQLSLNQTALQAALQVTSGLNQLSLLKYLPVSGG